MFESMAADAAGPAAEYPASSRAPGTPTAASSRLPGAARAVASGAAGAPSRVLTALAPLVDALVEDVRGAGGWTSRERDAVLAGLDRVTGAVATARAHVLVAEREAGTSVGPGDRSFEAARARRTRQGLGEAARQVRQADALVSMPVVAAAVRSGDVPLEHLDAVARTSARAPLGVAERLASAEGQATVVQMARSQTGPEFARSLAQLVATMDPGALERDHDAQRRERFLVLTDRPDGTFLRGRLDRMAGEALRLAVEAVGEVPGADRSPEQAAADALVALAERAIASGRPTGVREDAVSGVSARPHVSLVVPVATLAELRAHHAADRARASVQGKPGGEARVVEATVDESVQTWTQVPPATTEDGVPVPMSVLARALCDCEVTRIAVTADGVPTDLGRTRRVYTGAQRRAVIVRDRQCAWNGCGKPARWGEVHHIRWWDRDGGRTSVSNGVLLCVYHHHEVHRLDLTVERHSPLPGRDRDTRSRPDRGVGLRPPAAGAGTAPPAPSARYTFRSRSGRAVSAPSG